MIQYLMEYNRYLCIIGILVVLLIAWAFSKHRRKISYWLVINALALQFVLGILTLKTSWGTAIIGAIANGFAKLYAYAGEGAEFVFGPLAKIQEPWGVVFAFKVLTAIVFFAALISILLHFRIIQFIALPISKLLYRILGTSAAETVCTVANSFLGQTEAPLMVKSYVPRMTKSEILTVMVGGMGTSSAALFVVYASFGAPLPYILSSVIMAIPSTILISKLLLPETEEPVTKQGLEKETTENAGNIFSTLSDGVTIGLQIALAVGAMLIAFVALVAFLNGLFAWVFCGLDQILSWMGVNVHIPCFTLQDIFGIIFAPIGWLFGLVGTEIFKAGQLLGTKIAINELMAYSLIPSMQLSERAIALMSFALCGFANFSSIGMQIAGIGAMAPNQRQNLSQLGLRALLGGTLANLLSAFIAGLLL